jgi:23S rRNA (guanosine2251-2'-O)-methyltransferase
MANSTKKTYKPTSRKISRATSKDNKDSKDSKNKKFSDTKKFTKSKPNNKKTVKFFSKSGKFADKDKFDKPAKSVNTDEFAEFVDQDKPARSSRAPKSTGRDKSARFTSNKDKPNRFEKPSRFSDERKSSRFEKPSKFADKEQPTRFDRPVEFLEADDFTEYMTQEKPVKFQRSAKTSDQKPISRYGKPDKFADKNKASKFGKPNKFEKSSKFDSKSRPAKKPAQFGKPVLLVDQELVYGIHPIVELLKAKKRKLYKVYTTNPEPKNWAQIARLLPNYTEIVYKERAGLDNLAQSTDHQSVVGLASPFVIRKQFFAPKLHPFLLLLDNIQDTRNLGAILRSAYCTGVTGVILTTRNSAPITPAVIKASAGLAEHLEIHLTPNATLAVQTLKDNGCKMYLATLDESKNAASVTYELPICLIIGNEATGISKSVIGSGQHITIPQVNPDVSYNASVAAGILCFLISSQNNLIK